MLTHKQFQSTRKLLEFPSSIFSRKNELIFTLKTPQKTQRKTGIFY